MEYVILVSGLIMALTPFYVQHLSSEVERHKKTLRQIEYANSLSEAKSHAHHCLYKPGFWSRIYLRYKLKKQKKRIYLVKPEAK